MIIHHFSPVPNVTTFLSVLHNGQKKELFPHHENGWIGCFQKGDKITFTISCTPGMDHKCFTLDQSINRGEKKAIGEGVYEKSLTVTINEKSGAGQVAPWPANMLCLEIDGKSYNVGIFIQNGIFYFVIEEYLFPDPDKAYLANQVRWFSLLRGFGSVTSENSLLDLRIHYSAVPRQANHLRNLETGDLLIISEIITTDLRTNFQKEIKACTLA